MTHYSKLIGSILAGVGFLLSPLSWWNDLIVNIPLAYVFATTISFVFPGYFAMFMILGYWFTNVLGLVLMHKGGQLFLGKTESRSYTIKAITKELSISLMYSIVIGILIVAGILKLPTEYFSR